MRWMDILSCVKSNCGITFSPWLLRLFAGLSALLCILLLVPAGVLWHLQSTCNSSNH